MPPDQGQGAIYAIAVGMVAVLFLMLGQPELCNDAAHDITPLDHLPFINNTAFSARMQSYVMEPPSHLLFVWGAKDVGKSTNIRHDCHKWEDAVTALLFLFVANIRTLLFV